jgi:hypothetical protein
MTIGHSNQSICINHAANANLQNRGQELLQALKGFDPEFAEILQAQQTEQLRADQEPSALS